MVTEYLIRLGLLLPLVTPPTAEERTATAPAVYLGSGTCTTKATAESVCEMDSASCGCQSASNVTAPTRIADELLEFRSRVNVKPLDGTLFEEVPLGPCTEACQGSAGKDIEHFRHAIQTLQCTAETADPPMDLPVSSQPNRLRVLAAELDRIAQELEGLGSTRSADRLRAVGLRLRRESRTTGNRD